MQNIFTWAPHPEDGTSRYRCWGVLPRLNKGAFNFIKPPPSATINWSDIITYDGVFLQRPFMPGQLQLAHAARRAGIPIVSDWDDDLFNVPSDNPTHAQYSDPASMRNVEEIAKLSTAISVSTEALAKSFRRFNQNVVVIPNALDTRILQPMDDALPRNPVVLWRGGHTHQRDVQAYSEEILDAYKEFPNFSFMFMGYNPWWLTEKMNPQRVRVLPFDNEYQNFINNMQRVRASIQIVPLADNVFNRCKSNVAHLEATLAGSAVLGPDWEEWQTTAYCYKDGRDFKEKLFNMMSMVPAGLAAVNESAMNEIMRNRTLNVVNEKRMAFLREAFK